MVEFRFQPKRRTSRRPLLFVTAIIVAVFLIDMLTGGALRSVVRGSVGAVWSASAHLRESIATTGYFRTHRSLASENAALRDQLEQYREDAAAFDTLTAESQELRAMVHLATEVEGVTAPIVSSFVTSPYGTFLIGAGESEHIRSGSIVLTSDGFVIGTVTDVHAHKALVAGTLASGSRVDVLIGTHAATVEGRGGGNGRAELPRDIPIATGTPVIAPTLGSRPIGIVGRVVSSQANAAEVAYVQLPINLSSLRYVYIIPPRD